MRDHRRDDDLGRAREHVGSVVALVADPRLRQQLGGDAVAGVRDRAIGQPDEIEQRQVRVVADRADRHRRDERARRVMAMQPRAGVHPLDDARARALIGDVMPDRRAHAATTRRSARRRAARPHCASASADSAGTSGNHSRLYSNVSPPLRRKNSSHASATAGTRRVAPREHREHADREVEQAIADVSRAEKRVPPRAAGLRVVRVRQQVAEDRVARDGEQDDRGRRRAR